MNFADNWARVFVVITFMTFGEAQIIGGIYGVSPTTVRQWYMA